MSVVKYSKISWTVFAFSLIIVMISLIPVLFPALISETVTVSELEKIGIIPYQEDPYQIGVIAIPLVVINVLVFVTYFFKNKFPVIISKLIKKLLNFKVSKKVATIIIVIILSMYVIGTVTELDTEEKWLDYIGIEDRLNDAIASHRFTIEDAIIGNQNYPTFEPHVKYSLLLISEKVFGNFKVIPFLASIALLILTYFFTKEITKNRFAGLVSMILVLQSNLFLSFDTSITYSNFWILFYLLSLYLVMKIWFTSPILFGLSIFSKALTAAFAPMSIFFILNSDIPKNHKIIIISVLAILLIAGSIMFIVLQGNIEQFRWDEFLVGFTSFAFQMRFDVITVLFLLPLIFGLFISSKNNKHANSISILIAGILLSAPLLTGMTDQTNQPYRFMPLIVFFAVGVGMLFSIKRI
ncbi:MAG TPA: hypothetical protein OQH54_07255 [Nitrosopumilus sp.]|nr:hypothetical protein [Nitrosopumilus sp.]